MQDYELAHLRTTDTGDIGYRRVLEGCFGRRRYLAVPSGPLLLIFNDDPSAAELDKKPLDDRARQFLALVNRIDVSLLAGLSIRAEIWPPRRVRVLVEYLWPPFVREDGSIAFGEEHARSGQILTFSEEEFGIRKPGSQLERVREQVAHVAAESARRWARLDGQFLWRRE